MGHPSDRARPATNPSTNATLGLVIGASATTIAGLLIQVGVEPTTDISVDLWRYPWESSGAFVTLSVEPTPRTTVVGDLELQGA